MTVAAANWRSSSPLPAIKFKGKGWYVNDYGRGGGSTGKDSKPESKVEPKAENKTESKPPAKSGSQS